MNIPFYSTALKDQGRDVRETKCIRKKFLHSLNSTYTEDEQEDDSCCSHCDYTSADPNGFFTFEKSLIKKRTASKKKMSVPKRAITVQIKVNFSLFDSTYLNSEDDLQNFPGVQDWYVSDLFRMLLPWIGERHTIPLQDCTNTRGSSQFEVPEIICK